MNLVVDRMIVVEALQSRTPRQSTRSTLRLFWCFLLCMFVGANAYATSQCIQWSANTLTLTGYSVTWNQSAQLALDEITGNCNATDSNKSQCLGNGLCSAVGYTCGPMTGNMIPGVWPAFSYRFTVTQTQTSTGTQTTYSQFPNSALNISSRDNPVGCQIYVSALFAPPAQCGPTCNGVGEPVNPASGAVYSTEPDVRESNGALVLNRFYNSTDPGGGDVSTGWRHSFSGSIKPQYSGSTYKPYVTSPDNSSLYNDESTACTSGFAQIQSRVSTWSAATASYVNGTCSLSVGATNIGALPLYYTSPPTPPPGTPFIIGYDVTRDDGQVIRFLVNSTSIVAPPGISMTLQQTASGFTITDNNNNVEQYDANGRLLAITMRNGVVQTMSYDGSGRLNGVVDSFGHQLTLSYDAQGRLASTVQQ